MLLTNATPIYFLMHIHKSQFLGKEETIPRWEEMWYKKRSGGKDIYSIIDTEEY